MNRQPLDLTQLALQTGGQDGLAREVLRLFVQHAPADLDGMSRAAGAERRALAHRLLGSARAVGATEVSLLAAAVEAGADDQLLALREAVEAAVLFIEAYLEA